MQKITGLSKEQLFLSSPQLSNEQQDILDNFIERFNTWEPIEYMINSTNFYGLDFFVDNRVLIPRDDTEILVKEAIHTIQSKEISCLYDIWTGSWAIALSITKNCPQLQHITAIDISKKALEVSSLNREKHQLIDKVTLLESNLLENISKLSETCIITANLPYIKDSDHENMDLETITYEPDLALYGWKETWFELYETLIAEILERKWTNTIYLFIEIGFDQYAYSKKYLTNKWLNFEYFKDSGWIQRCIKIEL